MTGNETDAAATQATFGYREIDAGQRQNMVNGVFASVAEHYDLMNDLMSGGLHRFWKHDLVYQVNPPRSNLRFRLLDVAGGTGDIAMRVMKRGGEGCRAVICDISPEMLDVGRRRVNDAGLADRIDLVEGNAETLAFESCQFDAYTISFGIRNVTNIDQALEQAYRVLKPGGHFLCLEFSKVTVPMLDRLYDFHSFNVIPQLGQWAANDRESYLYLVESIRKFLSQDEFAGLIHAAGFEQVSYRNLTGGIAAIHSAWRI